MRRAPGVRAPIRRPSSAGRLTRVLHGLFAAYRSTSNECSHIAFARTEKAGTGVACLHAKRNPSGMHPRPNPKMRIWCSGRSAKRTVIGRREMARESTHSSSRKESGTRPSATRGNSLFSHIAARSACRRLGLRISRVRRGRTRGARVSSVKIEPDAFSFKRSGLGPLTS